MFWAITGSQLLLLTAFIGVYINLLNMIPVSPLDGGRIGQIIGPRVVYVGLWWKTIVGGVLLTIMTVLFSYGVGTQPHFIDAVDVGVGFLFLLLFCAMDIQTYRWIRLRERQGLPPQQWPSPPIRPYPPARTRYTWLAIYVASVAVLWTAMWYLIMQLPPPP
jgi:membrane-associated protease RseP (regulator of RpoE activity)